MGFITLTRESTTGHKRKSGAIIEQGVLLLSICLGSQDCLVRNWIPYHCNILDIRGLPLITYAPRGRGGVKSRIHFHCVLHAERGEGV